MAVSEKMELNIDQETIIKTIREYVNTNMRDESIILFQEALLDDRYLEDALLEAVLNESIISKLEKSLETQEDT